MMLMEVLLLLFTLQKWIAEDQISKAIEAVEGGDKKVSRSKDHVSETIEIVPDCVFVCVIPAKVQQDHSQCLGFLAHDHRGETLRFIAAHCRLALA